MVQLVKGTAGDDHMIGTSADEWMLSGAGNDFIDGKTGDDHLSGHLGNDTLLGGIGNDQLLGGEGKDFLNGGWNNDILTGGTQADTFAFDLVSFDWVGNERPRSLGDDTVTDFKDGEDMLQLNMMGDFDNLNIRQVGSDTLITFDEVGGSITLTGLDFHTLDASDFYFL